MGDVTVLRAVCGVGSHMNDIIFSRATSLATAHLVLLPGDLSDFAEAMEDRVKCFSLEAIATRMSQRHPNHHVWVVRPTEITRTFAVYRNFLNVSPSGDPVMKRVDRASGRLQAYGGRPTGLPHLSALLTSASMMSLGSDSQELPVDLCVFSKGVVVGSQLVAELAEWPINCEQTPAPTLPPLASRLRQIAFLDVGLNMPGVLPTSPSLCAGFGRWANSAPHFKGVVFASTAYQMGDRSRPWVRKESEEFVAGLRDAGVVVVGDEGQGQGRVPKEGMERLRLHFNVLDTFTWISAESEGGV